jgi:hypothetical protein
MPCLAVDSPQHYPQARVAAPAGSLGREARITPAHGAWREFLAHGDPGSAVAGDTMAHWSWIMDEIEVAGGVPQLVQAHQAKRMMGMIHTTDTQDARGLNRLQRAGTRPAVWIPQGALRARRA